MHFSILGRSKCNFIDGAIGCIEKSKIRMTFDGIFFARPSLKLPKTQKTRQKSFLFWTSQYFAFL